MQRIGSFQRRPEAAYGLLLPQGGEGRKSRPPSPPAPATVHVSTTTPGTSFARRANLPQPDVIDLTPKSETHCELSRPTEGRLAIVTDAGRDAVDVAATQDE